MSMKHEKNKFSITVCREFFPEIYPAHRSSKWSRGEEDPLTTEMRLFCACMRWAFNRLLEGASRHEIKKAGQELFGLNSRYADDARLKAQALLDSQTELLKLENEETEKKLGRARKKLSLAMRKLAKAEEKGAASEVIEKLRLAVKGRNKRVVSLAKRLAELKDYREKGTIPEVVFGGRRLWEKVCQGRAAREKWRHARRNRLYSRGDESKGGNPNIKIFYEGRYLVHLTFEVVRVQEPDFAKGCLAIDTNPDGVALCNVSASGQPEPWPEGFSVPYPGNLGKYEGEFQVIPYPNGFLYIRIPDLAHASSFRRSYLIGVLARVMVDIAFFSGKPIVLENLNFSKDRLDTNKKFNRMASNFPFAKMVGAMYRRATKEGVPFKLVSPRHTSTIGYWKYMKRYAVPVHCAAALVIGRRAMGFRERVTEELRQLVSQIKQNLTRKVNPDRPGEGKGMTRGVRACLRRLEERLSVHNGLAQSEQEAYNSVWSDLKLLALSVR
ncbi:transposase, IS605 OrfB family, central region [Carboxydocella thermautotrophica]|nr:transposase, IS605 OrfB family, central region [Carboxydocella thermautotrophica]